MIKLILFDLDGVLVDMKNIHFDALNESLGEDYSISWEEHLSIYDGLKTNKKLEILSERRGLPVEKHKEIWDKKQKITFNLLDQLTPNKNLIDLMEELTKNEYKICVCSNSIRKTILITLSRLNIIKYIDLIVSNEDVKNSKPYPDIYWKAITKMGFLPEETLIVEDSPYGLLAAHRSKSHVFRVKNSTELSIKNIIQKISQINNEEKKPPKWEDEKLTILIPMAGEGSRFKQEGYILPKPLIDVNGKPMIQVVINNLNINANYIYIVQKQHREKYNLDTLLNIITPECKIVEVDGLTEGAACTVLLAKDFINNNNPLFLANSDQFVEWDSNGFMYKMNETNSDAGIVTFKSTEPKWSFVKVNEEGMVNEVAEKDPISDIATVGFYYWKHGSDFVKYAEEMIKNNIRVNNEFYICPVFNEAIKDNKKIRIFDVSKMWGLGTPKDLDYYLENHKKIKHE